MSFWSDFKAGDYAALRGRVTGVIAGRTSGLKIHPSVSASAASEFSHIVSSFNIRRDWGSIVPSLHQGIANHYQRAGRPRELPPQHRP